MAESSCHADEVVSGELGCAMGNRAVGPNGEALFLVPNNKRQERDVGAVGVGDSGDRSLQTTEQAHLIRGTTSAAVCSWPTTTSH